MVALLALYPVLVALLIGLALSRGPDKPPVAIANMVSPDALPLELDGRQVDLAAEFADLLSDVEPIEVSCAGLSEAQCERAATKKVESGEALAAIVVPPDLSDRLQGLGSLAAGGAPTVKVLYSSSDPVKAAYVEDRIKAQIRDVNIALTRQFAQTALSYLDKVVRGGTVDVPLGPDIEILGLERAEEIAREALGSATGRQRAELERVIRFTDQWSCHKATGEHCGLLDECSPIRHRNDERCDLGLRSRHWDGQLYQWSEYTLRI